MATARLLGRMVAGRFSSSLVTRPFCRTPLLGRFRASSSAVRYPLQLATVSENHATLYEESLKHPEQFWGDLARRRLRWVKEFDQVMDCDMKMGRISWFNRGILNVTGQHSS